MSQPMFTYNQDAGVNAGVSNYINETGAYQGRIVSAEWVQAKSGSAGVEFSFESSDGLKANYLTLYYRKADGSEIKGMAAMLNAIMGCCKVSALTSVLRGDKYFCPELENKSVGLVLQKVLTTKQDGSDSYKFEIRIPFIPQTGKTLAEQIGNKDAITVSKMASTLTDKDERNSASSQQQSASQDPYMNNFVDDGSW